MVILVFSFGYAVPKANAAVTTWPVTIPIGAVEVDFGHDVVVGDVVEVRCALLPNVATAQSFLFLPWQSYSGSNGSLCDPSGDKTVFTWTMVHNGPIKMRGMYGSSQLFITDVKVNGVSINPNATTPTPSSTPTPTPTSPTSPTPTPTSPTPTPTPTSPTPTPTPTPKPTPPPLTVNFIGNKTSLVVQISGGSPPYTVDWLLGQQLVNGSTYTITGLEPNTTYTVIVTDSKGESVTSSANTGNFEGFIPPEFPSPGGMFQGMIDHFGVAGTIALAIAGAAVALGILVMLGFWGWRVARKWLNSAK